MKRFVVALAVLLSLYGLARADYIIIIYDVAASNEQPAAGNGMMGGVPGFVGGQGMGGGQFPPGMQPPGGRGMGGGQFPPGMQPPGGRGMGGGQFPPGMQPPGGMGGGQFPPGMQPPGGQFPPGGRGMGGGQFPPGMQPPGGMGGLSGSGPPGGLPGGLSGGGPPAGGASGGGPPGGDLRPPSGGFGGFSGGGPPGGMPGGMFGLGGGLGMGGFFGGMTQPEQNFTPVLAVAVVEVEKASAPPTLQGIVHAYHKWSGKNGSYVVPFTQDKHLHSVYLKRPSVRKRYEEQYKVYHPNNKPTPDGLFELAEWALKHDLLDEFVKVMDELAKLDPKNDAVVAFQQVQAAMAKPITKGDASDVWRTRVLDGYKVEKSEHYALLHNLDANKPAEVESRLKRLENHYRAFFYWFALKGKVLPVPDQRLVAVLVKQGEQFKRQQQIFDALPTVSDGFLARRDNLAVFSLERTDLASEALARNTKSLWSAVTTDPDTSLRDWPKSLVNGRATKVDMLAGAELQTFALLERALQEDAEIASVTHEGTRQLLAATGQLPRNVAVPEWLQFGWASFFETPKGSPWMTVGTPSSTLLPEYNYLQHYKLADKAGKLEKQRWQTLAKVVTDGYFREYAAKPKSEDARIKARTMAWALTYYLANKQLDGLRRYQEELKKLPRDLEFDPETLLLTFARAFDCLDGGRFNQVDTAKLEKLANQWHDFISLTPAEDEALIQELTKAQHELKGRYNKPPEKPEANK